MLLTIFGQTALENLSSKEREMHRKHGKGFLLYDEHLLVCYLCK